MIKFDDRFSADHDGRQWVLTETYMGKETKREGKVLPAKEQTRESYYGSLRQVCKKVLDQSIAGAYTEEQASTEDLMSLIYNMEWKLEGMARGFE